MKITIEHGDTVAVVEVSDAIWNLPNAQVSDIIGEQIGRGAIAVHDLEALDAPEEVAIIRLENARDVGQIEDTVRKLSMLFADENDQHELSRFADDGNPNHA